jgi:hypothetical protein
MAFDRFEDSDSDESNDFDSPEKQSFLSRVFCGKNDGDEVRSDKLHNHCTSISRLSFDNRVHFKLNAECSEAVNQDRERQDGCTRKEG